MPMAARLLLAEDSLTIQKVFELTFKQSGISLPVVPNGDGAGRLAKEISPDIVVADVSLPGKDGFQVATELRSTETAAPCPVLILPGTLAPFDEGRVKGGRAERLPVQAVRVPGTDRQGRVHSSGRKGARPGSGGEGASPPSRGGTLGFQRCLDRGGGGAC